MAVRLTDDERKVLEAYKRECDADPEGAFGPAFHGIANAVTPPSVDVALAVCKNLKKRGLLEGETGRGAAAALTSSYWISEKGAEALT